MEFSIATLLSYFSDNKLVASKYLEKKSIKNFNRKIKEKFKILSDPKIAI